MINTHTICNINIYMDPITTESVPHTLKAYPAAGLDGSQRLAISGSVWQRQAKYQASYALGSVQRCAPPFAVLRCNPLVPGKLADRCAVDLVKRSQGLCLILLTTLTGPAKKILCRKKACSGSDKINCLSTANPVPRPRRGFPRCGSFQMCSRARVTADGPLCPTLTFIHHWGLLCTNTKAAKHFFF